MFSGSMQDGVEILGHGDEVDLRIWYPAVPERADMDRTPVRRAFSTS
jgi:hypothetical protein